MFPFVSILPSQSIVLRRWHRRRSRKNDKDDGEVGDSNLLQPFISQKRTTAKKSSSKLSSNLQQYITFSVTFALLLTVSQGRTAFEKMTDLDYVGETYYTIRNLSLYECQGWCREEPECSAASFSFAVNPNSSPPRQETVCLLQNGTQATNPSAKPLRALNQYYMVKMSVRSDKVCKRPWNFERVPNAMIQGHDRALIFTSTKEACLAACLNEKNFICRSAEYNYVTLQCRLSDYDRRSLSEDFQAIQLTEAQGVDYFENLCLNSGGACEKSRRYATPNFGLPEQKVALHVGVHFYIDKELMANSETACERACTFETEFLCRSYLYLGAPTGSDYNCKLYHLDHWTIPAGISAFLNSQTPLVGDGSRIGKYYENRCERSSDFTNGVTSGTTSQLGGEGVFPTVVSGGGNNGNGASNNNGAGINGGSNGISNGGGSNNGGNVGGGGTNGVTVGGGSNGGNVIGGSNGGVIGGGSNGVTIGGGINGGNIVGGGNNGALIGGGSNGGTIGGGNNGGVFGGGNNGGIIGGGGISGGSSGIGGGNGGVIGGGGSNGGNIGGITNVGGGNGNGNGNNFNGQGGQVFVSGQSGTTIGGIGNGQNGGINNNNGGNGNSQTDNSGGFNPALGGQIGLGPGGTQSSSFIPGVSPGQGFPPGGGNINPGTGNNPFGGQNGGINNGGNGGISIGGNGGNNGGSNGINNGGGNGGGNGINNAGNGGNNIFGQGGTSSINNGGGNRPGPSFGQGDNAVGGGGVNVVGGGGGGAGINPDFGDPDVNCDNQGTCYDVTVHCKDTRIVVNVGTNRPFSGRIYALGRSETCNVDVISSDSFRLDLTMAGQDCNTQSVNGIYTNTVVVQRHSVVMTKTDKIYKVRCTYDTSSRNVTFGMMPIRDPDMISITSAPEAPAPRISILDSGGKEVETVRIGDQLTFKIEIPDKTPYGIFARSCLAMAKDSRSTFAIIDENGCPIDPTIFPRFTPDGAALISQYEAFRFTESYGVIFQCNVKYCLGPCPPTNCQYGRESFDSWGRRKREAREKREIGDDGEGQVLGETQMRLSHEIIVLDYGDEQTSPFDNIDNHFTSQRRDRNDNATDYHATPLDWKNQHVSEQAYDSGTVNSIECPTSRNSVLALAVTCSLLVILYVVTVMCMCYRKAVFCSDDDLDDRCSTSTTKSTMLPEAILRGLPSPTVTHVNIGGGGYIPNDREYMR